MKILFDAYTPPDIQLYTALGKKLKDFKFDVEYIIPSNEECINLMNKKKISYKIVGSRSPKRIMSKIFSNLIRAILVMRHIYVTKPDVVISRAVSTPIVAKLLKRKVVMFIDNDAATLALLFTLPFGDRIYMPKAIEIFGDIPKVIKRKTYFYDGIEEQIYLTGMRRENIYEILKLERDKNIIVVRPFGIITEYESSGEDYIEKVLNDLVQDKRILEKYHIIVLPRNKTQKIKYKKFFKNVITIPPSPLDGESLLLESLIFIGAGGTMTREAWVLGNVVFSFYKGKKLSVEKWLSQQKDYFYNIMDKEKILKTSIKTNLNTKLILQEKIIKDFIRIFHQHP